MTNIVLSCILMSVLFATATAAQTPASSQHGGFGNKVGPIPIKEPPDYEIGGVKAHLYYELTGTFSPGDLLLLPPGSLWNTHGGEGAAKQPSTTTLVLVEVIGDPDAVARGRSVQLIARQRYRDGRKTIVLQKKIGIGVLSSEGRYSVPFLLYETGCLPVELSAALLGQKKHSRMVRVIEFACGE